MFPASRRAWLYEYGERKSPGGAILLDGRKVLEGLLVECVLRWIGCNQDGLDELVEILVHGGEKKGVSLDTRRWRGSTAGVGSPDFLCGTELWPAPRASRLSESFTTTCSQIDKRDCDPDVFSLKDTSESWKPGCVRARD